MNAMPPDTVLETGADSTRQNLLRRRFGLKHRPNDANRRMHFGKGVHRHIIMQHSGVEGAVVEKVLVDNTRRFAGRQRVCLLVGSQVLGKYWRVWIAGR